jgi:hypothetical protein
MDTRGHDCLEVWEAAGAGKRGKKVRLVSIAFPPNAYGDTADINHKLMQAVTACTTIEEVQAAVAAVALKRFINEMCAGKCRPSAALTCRPYDDGHDLPALHGGLSAPRGDGGG